MENLDKAIGSNIKRIRQEHNLSMDQVAELTGVSKSMIARIESGASIPTVTTLWKICNGLKVSFSTMLDDPTELDVVVNKDSLKSPTMNDSHELYTIIPFDVNKKFETYEMTVHSGASQTTGQHVGVIEEVIYILKGNLTMLINDKERHLIPGDVYKFKPDCDHTYKNEATEAVTFMVTVVYN